MSRVTICRAWPPRLVFWASEIIQSLQSKNASVLNPGDYTTRLEDCIVCFRWAKGSVQVVCFRSSKGSTRLTALVHLKTDSKHAFRWQRSFPGIAALSLAMSASAVGLTSAQETQSTQQTQSTAGGLPVTANSGRRLAADAIHIISPNLELGDTVEGPVTLPLKSASQLEWTPNFAPVSETLVNKVKDQVFRNEIWGFELGFKPVRMIGVDMTDPATGESKTKVVWYLLYYVKYKGGDVVPKAEKDEFGNDVYNPTPTAGRVQRHFIPSFTLNSTSLGKRVDCKLIPQAIPLITGKRTRWQTSLRPRGHPARAFEAIDRTGIERSLGRGNMDGHRSPNRLLFG